MKNFILSFIFCLSLSGTGLLAISTASKAQAQVPINAIGRDPYCETNPSADQCAGTRISCAVNPTSDACRGSITACQNNPGAEECSDSKIFCQRNPSADRCLMARQSSDAVASAKPAGTGSNGNAATLSTSSGIGPTGASGGTGTSSDTNSFGSTSGSTVGPDAINPTSSDMRK